MGKRFPGNNHFNSRYTIKLSWPHRTCGHEGRFLKLKGLESTKKAINYMWHPPLRMGSINWKLKIRVKGGRVWDRHSGGLGWGLSSLRAKVTRLLTISTPRLQDGKTGIFSPPLRRGPGMFNFPGFTGDLWAKHVCGPSSPPENKTVFSSCIYHCRRRVFDYLYAIVLSWEEFILTNDWMS